MRLCNEAHAYATVENAEKALTKALARCNRTLNDTRYLIAVNAIGRFVPVIIPADNDMLLMSLVHVGISIVR